MTIAVFVVCFAIQFHHYWLKGLSLIFGSLWHIVVFSKIYCAVRFAMSISDADPYHIAGI